MRFSSILIASSLPVVLALALVSGQGLASLNQPAQVIGMPFMTTDCVTYAMPASFGGFVCTEFNSTSLAQHDAEDLSIDFPLFTKIGGDKKVLGATKGAASADGASLGAGSTSNILPLGPVDLAFPHVHQDVDQSTKYSDTYFFTDTLG